MIWRLKLLCICGAGHLVVLYHLICILDGGIHWHGRVLGHYLYNSIEVICEICNISFWTTARMVISIGAVGPCGASEQKQLRNREPKK